MNKNTQPQDIEDESDDSFDEVGEDDVGEDELYLAEDELRERNDEEWKAMEEREKKNKSIEDAHDKLPTQENKQDLVEEKKLLVSQPETQLELNKQNGSQKESSEQGKSESQTPENGLTTKENELTKKESDLPPQKQQPDLPPPRPKPPTRPVVTVTQPSNGFDVKSPNDSANTPTQRPTPPQPQNDRPTGRPVPAGRASVPTVPMVTALDRSDAKLTEIPSEILVQTSLLRLTLTKNLLNDKSFLTFPSTSFSKLKRLDVSYNRLTVFPDAFCDLVSVEELLLAGNRIQFFPPAKKLAQLISLQTLQLAANRLTYFPWQLCSIPNLIRLDLFRNEIENFHIQPQYNQCNGESKDFQNWATSLSLLDLRKNNLTTLPPELTQLNNLQELKLSDNQLISIEDVCSPTAAFKGMTNLSVLELNNNRLPIMHIHLHLAHLSASVKAVFLKNNRSGSEDFVDSPTDNLGVTARRLETLNLFGNRLPKLPIGIIGLLKEVSEALTTLDLASNSLTEIPSVLAECSSLTDLNLGDNNIQLKDVSSLSWIGQLTGLMSLNLSNNQLTELPKEVEKLTNLSHLFLAYNQLKDLPKFSSFEFLQELFLNGNPQIGSNGQPFDHGIWGLPNLQCIYLSDCGITQIHDPVTSDDDLKLEVLDLSFNQLTSVAIDFLRKRRFLLRLNLSHNSLKEVPEALCALYDLEEVDLTGNPFELTSDQQELIQQVRRDMADRGAELLLDPHLSLAPSSSHLLPTMNPGTRYRVGFAEMKGTRPTMEDAWSLDGSEVGQEIFTLFDGHAGRQTATFCAARFPETFRQQLAEQNVGSSLSSEEDEKVLASLSKSFHSLQSAWEQHLPTSAPGSRHAGATAVVVCFRESRIYVANAGDSRAVFGCASSSSASKWFAKPLSHDHKPFSKDEEDRIREVYAGNVVGETGRVNGQLAVSRSLGDVYMQPWVICDPFIASFEIPAIQSGAYEKPRFLIVACDGIWDEVSNEYAVQLVGESLLKFNDPFRAAMILRDYAYLSLSDDNISVIVICLD